MQSENHYGRRVFTDGAREEGGRAAAESVSAPQLGFGLVPFCHWNLFCAIFGYKTVADFQYFCSHFKVN